MNGVAVFLIVLAGLFLLPVAIAVVASGSRVTGLQIAVGLFALVVMGVGAAAWAVNSAMHPSAAGLGHKITSAPVPPEAKLLSQDIQDGDFEEQPQASMSYALPGSPNQECVAVVQTYLDSAYRISSANTISGPAKPVVSAATVCANGFIRPDVNTPYPYLEMAVCKGQGKSEKCFRATLSPRTAQDKDLDGPYAPAGNSVLFLEA